MYAESHGRLSAYIVSELVHNPRKVFNGEEKIFKGYQVDMWSLDFDGTFVGRRARDLFIPPFGGERKITGLSVIPCDYKDKEDDYKTRNALIGDGKRWYRLLRGGQVYYTGHLLDNRKREVSAEISGFHNPHGVLRLTLF